MKKFIEENTILVLILIFCIGITIYGIIASQMTSPAYLGVDEELYVSMARSFFYDNNFSQDGQILSYKCVLYSIVISIAYAFGTSGNIVFFMRMIGVILMVSSIFPTYLIAKEVLKDKTKATACGIFSLILPGFALTLYLVQEVLCYPVFLWIAYLIYIKFEKDKNGIIDIVISTVFALIYFIKSYTVIFGISYYLTLLLIAIKNKQYKNIKKILLYGSIFVLIIAVLSVCIYAINDFQYGYNHYSGQIKSILPIDTSKIVAFIYGTFYYSTFFLLSMGILPILVPILNINKAEENDKKFILYLTITTILTILEISVIVFIPEERDKILPYKFCERYLAPFFIPYLLMFTKLDKKDLKPTKTLLIICSIVFLYIIVYFIKQGTIVSAIDAPAFFMIQMFRNGGITRKMFAITYTIIGILILFLWKMDKITNIKKTFMIICIIVLIICFPFNIYSHLLHSNVHFAGQLLKGDFIKISEYIGRDFDKVYILRWDSKLNTAVKLIYPYLFSDYITLYAYGDSVEIETGKEKIAIIVSEDFKGKIIGADKADTETNFAKVYTNAKENSKIKIIRYE